MKSSHLGLFRCHRSRRVTCGRGALLIYMVDNNQRAPNDLEHQGALEVSATRRHKSAYTE